LPHLVIHQLLPRMLAEVDFVRLAE
jgi:hypothetical protein